MKKPLVFAVLFFGFSQILPAVGLLRRDEAWLVAGLIAILVVYWLPPTPKQKYVTWLVPKSALVLGAYLCVFKVPWLLADFVSYDTAAIICLIAYFAFCWFVFRRMTDKRKHNST